MFLGSFDSQKVILPAIPKSLENTCKLILKNKKAIKSRKFIAKV
jgi:hypothetical protein